MDERKIKVPDIVHDAVLSALETIGEMDSIEENRNVEKHGSRLFRFPSQRPVKIAAIVLAGVLVLSLPAAAALNYVKARMENMEQAEVEEQWNMIYENRMGRDLSNRELTEGEIKRMSELEYAYEGGRFPEGRPELLGNQDGYSGSGIAYYAETGMFYYPAGEMSDEELLQIIEFRHKRDYSLTNRNESMLGEGGLAGADNAGVNGASQGNGDFAGAEGTSQGDGNFTGVDGSLKNNAQQAGYENMCVKEGYDDATNEDAANAVTWEIPESAIIYAGEEHFNKINAFTGGVLLGGEGKIMKLLLSQKVPADVSSIFPVEFCSLPENYKVTALHECDHGTVLAAAVAIQAAGTDAGNNAGGEAETKNSGGDTPISTSHFLEIAADGTILKDTDLSGMQVGMISNIQTDAQGTIYLKGFVGNQMTIAVYDKDRQVILQPAADGYRADQWWPMFRCLDGNVGFLARNEETQTMDILEIFPVNAKSLMSEKMDAESRKSEVGTTLGTIQKDRISGSQKTGNITGESGKSGSLEDIQTDENAKNTLVDRFEVKAAALNVYPRNKIVPDLVVETEKGYRFWGYDGLYEYDRSSENTVCLKAPEEYVVEYDGLKSCAGLDGSLCLYSHHKGKEYFFTFENMTENQ